LQGQPDISCEVKPLQEFLKIAIPLNHVKNLASLKVKGENNEALLNSYGISLRTFDFDYGRRDTDQRFAFAWGPTDKRKFSICGERHNVAGGFTNWRLRRTSIGCSDVNLPDSVRIRSGLGRQCQLFVGMSVCSEATLLDGYARYLHGSPKYRKSRLTAAG
jgi:hypothetical protein